MGKDLAQRVEQRDNGKTDERALVFASMLERQKPAIAKALPGHMSADRLTRIGLTVFRQNPDLQKCDPLSILGSLMTCAQLGLEPGPLGHAYLVPFKGECTFILGYKGMVDLVRRTGQLGAVRPGIVYQRELDDGRFEAYAGSDARLVHKPIIFEEAGPAVGWYVLVKLTSGEEQFVVLSRKGVEKFRARSKQPNGFAWRNDYDPMAHKTCMRRLFPWLPVSVELAQALGQDEQVRTDIEPAALDATPLYIEGDTVEPPAAEAPVEGVVVEDPPGEVWPPVAQPGTGTGGESS